MTDQPYDPLEKWIGAIATNIPGWADCPIDAEENKDSAHKIDDDELVEEYDLASLPVMPKGRYAPDHSDK
jgi:hypothetical protein